jgi:hypothetical protein
VWQIDKKTVAKIPLGTGQATPGAVGVDGAYVYWNSSGGEALLRAPIGGAAPFQPLYSSVSGRFLAVDDTDVYWSDPNGGVDAAPKAGGGAIRRLAGTNKSPLNVGAVSQDATALYGTFWYYTPDEILSIGRLDKASGVLTEYWSYDSHSDNYYLGAAIDASNFYYIESFSPQGLTTPLEFRLGRVAKMGTTLLKDVIPPGPSLTTPLPMVADGCAVYWGVGSTLYRASPGGSAPYVLTNAAVTMGEMVLDDSYVYWVDKGWIGRVPR